MRALPELLARTPTAWQVTEPHPGPHQPTATPHKKQAKAHQTDDEAGELSRLVALVASRHNTKRPDIITDLLHNTAPNITSATIRKTMHACQELRNRALAHQTPTGAKIPPTRYYIPEQIAGHHATTKTAPDLLELVAMMNNPSDLATYLSTLEKHHADDLKNVANSLIEHMQRELAQITETLATGKKSRHAYRYKGKTLRLSDTERQTISMVNAILSYQERAEQAHQKTQKAQARNAKRTRQAQSRLEQQQKAGNHTPPDSYDPADWLPVIPHKPPREINHTGRLGRRKISTNTGKNPNRIHNYYGDPHRRIFSRTTRGTKALVLVDASGSMSLTTDDLEQIMKASAGATVIAYSASNLSDPNTHLLAHNNRRVRELPRFDGGNGIDAPALVWATKNYRETGAPLLWITDGKATGSNGTSHRQLRLTCKQLAQKHGAHLAPDVERALSQLHALKTGKPPHNWQVFH